MPITPPASPLRRAVSRIERHLGFAKLEKKLAEELRRTDLATLLIGVFKRRVGRIDARTLYAAFTDDPFVQPSPINMLARIELERFALETAARSNFVPTELSPLCPLGTCSVVAPVSPSVVEPTIRGREVVSDPSNVLALEAARKRRGRTGKLAPTVSLCTSQRVVRTPRVAGPGLFQHFRIFALLTSGRAQGGARFELETLREHIAVHLELLAHAGVAKAKLVLFDRTKRELVALAETVGNPLRERFGVEVEVESERPNALTYYPGVSFTLGCVDTGMNLSDGGVVDWTAKLLSNRRERCVISGSGIDRLVAYPGRK